MISLINDLRKKLNELEERILEMESNKKFPPCITPMQLLQYVDLSNGSNEDKMKRIVEQIQEYNINILATPKDSNIVRSALVAELGEKGLKYWLAIRKFREDFNEQKQIMRYNNALKYSANNYMNFGAVINRYKQAIDLYNENNNNKQIKN
jgi:hypothetical protein